MAVHERLNLERWTKEFPLSRLRAEARDYVLRRRQQLPQYYPDENAVEKHVRLMSPEWEIVVGPRTVAVNEQLRTEALAAREYRGTRIATDVAVWAKGEPPNRAVTKLGGLPYRPAREPWPKNDSGEPVWFIGQLCFTDSTDLVPALPGDILLIFGDDDALLEPERLVFEWWRLASEPLTNDMPASDDPLTPFYAALHRTEDWEDGVFEGTKIGGMPRFIQDEPDVPGAFIGAIGSISVSERERYPFLNVPEPRGASGDNDLMIGDMGSLYLFMDSGGKVHAVSQCY